MPSSDPSNISLIVKIAQELKPTSILDIGVGNGKYGVLFREYLDGHYQGHAFHDPKTWTLKMHGLEIFEEYLTTLHYYVYDKITVVDSVDYVRDYQGIMKYDLIFMGDFIEHLDKEVGRQLIQDLSKRLLKTGGALLISTPNFDTQIDNSECAVFGNLSEVHKCRWLPADFALAGFTTSIVEGKLLTVVMRKK